MTPPHIAGGYVLVPTEELCAAWSMYQAKRIRLIDLRTWFACREVATRRRFASGRKVQFTIEEVHRLIGGVGGEHVRGSIRRLQAAGLLAWSEHAIAFANPVNAAEEVQTRIRTMRERLGTRQCVPVPRRLLRLLAGGCRRAVIATLLAHLLRCLFIRKGQVSVQGYCKISWVADVFGVAERNVKDARRHLTEIGVLVSHDVPQWRLNRFGKFVTLNIRWSRGGEGTTLSTSGSSPLQRPSTTRTAPPESDERLPSDSKNQKPAAGGASGVLRKQDGGTAKPRLSNIVPADLANTKRLLELFREAVARKLVPSGEHSRLQFVAAAEHARAIGSKNPPGLFSAIVRRKLWHVVTQADEDAAVRRIKSLELSARKVEASFRASRSETPNQVAQLLSDLVASVRQIAAANPSGDW